MALRDTQTKTIALLEAAATASGFELINDRKFGNTGTLRIERKTSVTPLINISYSFQDEYATFTVTPSFDMGIRGDGNLHAVRPEQLMERLVTPLTKAIRTLDRTKATA